MDLGERSGNRAVGIGEIPYFDPRSQSRAEALGLVKPETKPTTNGVHGHGMDQGAHGGHEKIPLGTHGTMAPGGHGLMAHGDHVISHGSPGSHNSHNSHGG